MLLNTLQKKYSSITAIDKEEVYDFSLNTIKPLKNGGWKNYVLGVIYELLLCIDYLKENNPNNLSSGILTTDGIHMNQQRNAFLARIFEAFLIIQEI